MSATESRQASWLELFFDLVVVAAVVQLAHRLHGDPSSSDIGVFAVLYLAVWMAWTSFTVYANVAGETVRRRVMLVAMFGIAVMAACVPQATGDRAVVFAGAYIFVRVLAIRTMTATGRMLLAWPSVQVNLGILPWIASLFLPASWRYALWGLGLTVDLLLPIVFRPRDAHRPAARLDLPHLAERLGLFLIIVLGEAVMQLVNAAAGTRWDLSLVLVGTAGFVLLILLWAPIFGWGWAVGNGREVPMRLVMPLHFLNTASITAIAAGLGSLTAHAHGHIPHGVRWLLSGGLAVYFGVVVILGAYSGHRAHRLAVMAGLTVVLPVLLGVSGAGLAPPALVWLLVLAVGGQVVYAAWDERSSLRLQNG